MKFDLLMHHPILYGNNSVQNGNYKYGWGKGCEIKDDELLNYLCDYFISRTSIESVSEKNCVWFSNIERQKPIIDALLNKNFDVLHNTLAHLFSSPLTYGIAQGDTSYVDFLSNDILKKEYVHLVYDRLIALMEMLDIVPIFSPEEYTFVRNFDQYYHISPDDYLDRLSNKFAVDISAPKYVGDLLGLDTKYGIFDDRCVLSLGIALLVMQKFPDRSTSICEIGGGVGHLAYYLYKFGYKNVTIVDLPTISVAQSYFLSVNLGKDLIRLISPKEFTGEYEVVINVDSMTEMNIESAKEYCSKIKTNSEYFLSINHETNPFTVSSICEMRKISRHPFWLRKGYVFEEYV